MKTSDRGIFAIAVHEGIVPAPYLDSVGVLTWGVDIAQGIRYAFAMSIKHLNEVLASQEMLESLKKRFWAKVKIGADDECWPWTAKAVANYGYGRMTAGRGRHLRSHQIAWALKNGPIPNGVGVLHSCDNPSCCNPSHLRIGTQKENAQDAIEKGRWSRPPRYSGESHPQCKLTDRDVADIRADNSTIKSLALKYDVSEQTIWRIRNNKVRL